MGPWGEESCCCITHRLLLQQASKACYPAELSAGSCWTPADSALLFHCCKWSKSIIHVIINLFPLHPDRIHKKTASLSLKVSVRQWRNTKMWNNSKTEERKTDTPHYRGKRPTAAILPNTKCKKACTLVCYAAASFKKTHAHNLRQPHPSLHQQAFFSFFHAEIETETVLMMKKRAHKTCMCGTRLTCRVHWRRLQPASTGCPGWGSEHAQKPRCFLSADTARPAASRGSLGTATWHIAEPCIKKKGAASLN